MLFKACTGVPLTLTPQVYLHEYWILIQSNTSVPNLLDSDYGCSYTCMPGPYLVYYNLIIYCFKCTTYNYLSTLYTCKKKNSTSKQ